MIKARKSIVGALGAAALCFGLAVTPVVAQSMTTAEIADLSANPLALGEHTYETSKSHLDMVLAPINQLRSGIDSGSTTMIGQIGKDNFAHAGIEGSGSLAMITQSGSNNHAVQAIQGNSSAMLLVQSGSDNNVLQASQGNNNVQALGVSGNNNDVAYLQVGNDLAGAMSVGGTNSAVFALQTPGSSNYMMPSGLNGLRDQVVIVVPGRMYVFDRNQL